jgi:hypothetical protein
MQIVNPYAFFLLGLIPILILIHSLRPKPRELVVTNLFLWREALRQRASGVRIRRIIQNLPLLLQIAIVILATFALANLSLPKSTELKGDVVLVVDTSASMKARGEDIVRFDRAREEAFRLVDRLPKGRKMLILEAGSKPRIRSPFSEDREHLKRVIKDLVPTDTPGDIEETLYLALSFMDPDRNDSVFLITDGAGGRFASLAGAHPKLDYELVTGGSRNVGITKFEFRQELEAKDRYEILLEVKNYNANPTLCPLRLSLDGKTFVAKTVGLKPLERKLLIFPYSGLIAGIAEVNLELADDFPTDNRAISILSASKDIWVLLVSEGNFFLENLLGAYPNVKVNSLKEIVASSWAEQVQRHDIVIVDRVPHPTLHRGNYLLIKSLSPSFPARQVGELETPKILDWDRSSPLMAGLDLSSLRIDRAMRVETDDRLQTLLESPDSGLMYAFEQDGVRAIFMGFDLSRSDLPLRVAFPVMMSNIFNWLYPNKLRFSSRQVQAGMPFPVHLRPATEKFSVRDAEGEWRQMKATSNPQPYDNTERVGIYLVSEGKDRRYFAVNLVDEEESDIRTLDSVPTESANGDIRAETIRTLVSIWPYLLLLGLLVLVLEWVVWCKRPY